MLMLQQAGLVATGGWDGVLNFWDLRQATPAGSIPGSVLKERVYAMAAGGSVLQVATAERQILTFDASRMPEAAVHVDQSPLPHQTRSLAVDPAGSRWAVGSVGGRILVQPVAGGGSAVQTSQVTSFNCHSRTPQGEYKQDARIRFPVNCLAWNPHSSRANVLASGGGDGALTIWDLGQRRAAKQATALGGGVTAVQWSPSGSHLAYAVGQDWSGASAVAEVPAQLPTQLRLQHVR